MSDDTKDTQKVQITLREYLEYQELLAHKKEVKITVVTKYKDQEWQGLNISWDSDGKVWYKLASKLQTAGGRIAELIKERDALHAELERYKRHPIMARFVKPLKKQ